MSNIGALEVMKRAQVIFDSMSIEEQAGQLFILAFPGKDPQVIFEIIDRYGIGGCYISQDNAETFSEATALAKALQQRTSKKQADIPLILGVDQEGAWGVLVPESTTGPGNLALGISDDTTHTDAMYRIFAQEMGAVGYQAILGPCSDINIDPQNPIIGTRSFGEKAERVALHVSAAVKAIRSQGLLSTAKHFPGHGDTDGDSHQEIPVVDKTMDRLLQQELLPFQAAIDAGVDMIMTAHILFPRIDSEYPATLSYKILTDLLRKQMNFQGLIITDSMNMGAIRKHYDTEDATVKAFLAGADLIMLSEEHYDHGEQYLERQIASIRSIIVAVNDGLISRDILRDRVLRILQKKLQMQHLTENKPTVRSDTGDINHRDKNKKIELATAKNAVHIIKCDNRLLPLREGQSIAILNTTPKCSYHNLMNVRGIGPNQAKPAFDSFSEAFRKQRKNVEVLFYEDLKDNLSGKLDTYDVLIAVTEDYPLPGEDFEKTEQQAMVRRIIEAHNRKLILLGLRSPYEIEQYPDLKCYVSTYSSRTCSAIAVADVLSAL